MIEYEKAKELRNKLLDHMESALAIADLLGAGAVGYHIERALDQARAETWPGDLDLPPR